MDYLSEQGLGTLSSSPVNVGDILAYTKRYADDFIFTKVVAVTKTVAKCDNGTSWVLRTGKLWGTASTWRTTTAYVVRDPAKVQALRRKRAATKQEKARRDAMEAELPLLVRDFSADEFDEVAKLVAAVKERKAIAFVADHFARWGW